MAKIIALHTISSEKGNLTICEDILPDGIKRLFYIYNVENQERGGHSHKETTNALICVNGKCKVYVNNGIEKQVFELDSPEKCLLLQPEDWHKMYDFDKNSVLLVLSNRLYDKADYIYEEENGGEGIRN